MDRKSLMSSGGKQSVLYLMFSNMPTHPCGFLAIPHPNSGNHWSASHFQSVGALITCYSRACSKISKIESSLSTCDRDIQSDSLFLTTQTVSVTAVMETVLLTRAMISSILVTTTIELRSTDKSPWQLSKLHSQEASENSGKKHNYWQTIIFNRLINLQKTVSPRTVPPPILWE